MKVLAFDQSSSTTGFAIGESGGDPRSYQFGSIKIPKREAFGERLAILHAELVKLIERSEPDLVAYEDTVLMLHGQGGVVRSQFGQRGFLPDGVPEAGEKARHAFNPDVMMKLQQVKAIVITVPALYGIPTEGYASATWRKVVLGYARPPKGAPDRFMKIEVRRRMKALGYETGGDDESDALGVLMCALHGPEASRRAQGNLLEMAGASL